MSGLTVRQKQYLSYIGEYWRKHGYPPSWREIGAHMGVKSTNAVNDCLRILVRKGVLVRCALDSRALKITKLGWAALGVEGCPLCKRCAA